MRIALVADAFPPQTGGMESHALGLAQALAGRHDTVVLTSRVHAPRRYDLPFEVRPVLSGALHRDLPEIAAVGADATLTLNAGHAPLARLLDGPVLCYCHGNDFLKPWIAFTADPTARAAALLGRAPGLAPLGLALKRWIAAREIGTGLSAAAAVIVNSAFTRDRLRAAYPALTGEIHVIPPGLPNAFLTPPAPRPAAPERPLRILTVARLSEDARWKRVDALLRGLALAADGIDFRHEIIGDGELRMELEALAETLGLSGRIRFLGALDTDGVRAKLDEADLFALTSWAPEMRGAGAESFGIVFAEAAARGTPCLAVRAGGVVDIVEDGVNGILVEDGRPETIAAGLERFASERGRFSSAEIAGGARRFAWPRIAARFEQLLAASAAHAAA